MISVPGWADHRLPSYRPLGRTFHAPRSRRGQDLVDDLLRFVADRDIPIAVGNRAERLLVEGETVVGAVVNGEDVAARRSF